MAKLIHQMPDSGTLQRTVLDHFRKVGQRGAIVDEISSALLILHQRISPTVSSLHKAGFIGPKGLAKRDSATGSPATVYVLTTSFTVELLEAGYGIWSACQCSRAMCTGHDAVRLPDSAFCTKRATEWLNTTAGRFEMCLECAASFAEDHSDKVLSSGSIGGKL
jgi:hypothetical protein